MSRPMVTAASRALLRDRLLDRHPSAMAAASAAMRDPGPQHAASSVQSRQRSRRSAAVPAWHHAQQPQRLELPTRARQQACAPGGAAVGHSCAYFLGRGRRRGKQHAGTGGVRDSNERARLWAWLHTSPPVELVGVVLVAVAAARGGFCTVKSYSSQTPVPCENMSLTRHGS